MQRDSLLALHGHGTAGGPLLRMEPPADYSADERRLSARVECEIDHLILGRRDTLLLLKVYPRRDDTGALDVAGAAASAGDVRPQTVLRIAAEALDFFGPLQGGIVVQETFDDLLLQSRRFSTAYPHINLERYGFYDASTREPLLGAWKARRIQNQRRETRTNRMIDVALLTLEVGKPLFTSLL